VTIAPAADSFVDILYIMYWLVVFGSVGIGEEMLARGYHLRNIAEGLRGRSLSATGAVLLAALTTSVIFGVLHLPNPNMTAPAAINLCVAGVVMVVPVLLTGRLALSIGFHTAWNFVLGNILGFPVSGLLIEHSLFRAEPHGPEWITGGAFGPEGGVVGLAINALAIAAFVAVVWSREETLAIASDWSRYLPPAWRARPAELPSPVPLEIDR
jgi:hypothetical protein